jgi:hypothetical protein
MQAANEEGVGQLPTPRLADLVMHLSGCSPERAVRTVQTAVHDTPGSELDDPLTILATALVALRRVDLRERVDIREQLNDARSSKPIA